MPIESRMMLMIISALMNSAGLSGEIRRFERLREYISSRNEIENPSWPRNRMSHSITAPMNVCPARAGSRSAGRYRSAASPT